MVKDHSFHERMAMTRIILTPEQSDLLVNARGVVVLSDSQGNTLAELPARHSSRNFTPEEIAEVEARIGQDGPYITTAELLEKLRALGGE
jgi:hypothetical protein